MKPTGYAIRYQSFNLAIDRLTQPENIHVIKNLFLVTQTNQVVAPNTAINYQCISIGYYSIEYARQNLIGKKLAMNFNKNLIFIGTLMGTALMSHAAISASVDELIDRGIQSIDSQVRIWRQDFHKHPEISNREFRTSKKVAEELKAMGIEVVTGVAGTGVVGLLRGAKPGTTIAYTADMDATLGHETNDLPFRSTKIEMYEGQQTAISHLCGHDAHTAMLMGLASVLTDMKNDIEGNVLFIFRPAEEGHVPRGTVFGARLMLQENVLETFGEEYRPTAIFGLHVLPREAGSITFREKSLLGSSDDYSFILSPSQRGQRGHAVETKKRPDAIATMASIITALKNQPKFEQDPTFIQPRIRIYSARSSAEPDTGSLKTELSVLINVYDQEVYDEVHHWVNSTVKSISDAAGIALESKFEPYAPVLYNDPGLVEQLRPSLARAIGQDNIIDDYYFFPASDDVALLQNEIPGIFMFLGVNKQGLKTGEAPTNHTPEFFVNEDTFQVGMKALATIGIDYLAKKIAGPASIAK